MHTYIYIYVYRYVYMDMWAYVRISTYVYIGICSLYGIELRFYIRMRRGAPWRSGPPTLSSRGTREKAPNPSGIRSHGVSEIQTRCIIMHLISGPNLNYLV